MTDKEQIIIDGVDVRKCEYLKESFTGLICADCNKSNDCSKSPNCYFKQLARKEQECKELKEKLEAYENLALHIKCPHCNKELDLILDGTEEKISLFDRYRKALEEIEEVCLTYSDNHDAYETVYKYILDVISKAKKEE